MGSVVEMFEPVIREMMKLSKGPSVITEDNVFQEGNTRLLPYIERIIGGLLLEGSGIRNLEALFELENLAASGKTCLILCEHYSNFDLPVLLTLLRKEGERGKALADKIVAIAGFKLNEDNPIVLAFAEAFSRIVIYPSRSIEAVKAKGDTPETRAELAKSVAINRAAMKALSAVKTGGNIVLVYPSGTRYRPWDPSSKKGVREIDSYLKSFDYILMLGINGNLLRPNPDSAMHEDIPTPDKMVLTCSDPVETGPFRERAKECADGDADKKQACVDAVMTELDRLHEMTGKSLS